MVSPVRWWGVCAVAVVQGVSVHWTSTDKHSLKPLYPFCSFLRLSVCKNYSARSGKGRKCPALLSGGHACPSTSVNGLRSESAFPGTRYRWPNLSVLSRLHFAVLRLRPSFLRWAGFIHHTRQVYTPWTKARTANKSPWHVDCLPYITREISCVFLHTTRNTSSYCTGLSGTIVWVFLFCSLGPSLPEWWILWTVAASLVDMPLLISASVPLGRGLWPLLHHPALSLKHSRTPTGSLSKRGFQKQNAKHDSLSNVLSYTMRGNLYSGFQRTT